MKTPKSLSLAMMLCATWPVSAASVQTVSETFIGSAVTVAGVQGSAERIGFFSHRPVRPALYSGKVTSVGATTITDARANWTGTQFSGRGSLYAEFANGLEADIQQVSFASKTLSFSGPVPPSLTAGVAYRIREHHTVAKIFGSANQAGLRSGANAADAETIRHFEPETQQVRTYFYVTFNGFTGWVTSDYSPASNIVIYPEQGLMIRRVTAPDLTLTSSGPLKQVPSTIPVYPGNNLLGLYNRSTPVRLDDLGLVSAGLNGGPNAEVSDILRKFNADGMTTTTYFYVNLAGFEGWYDMSYQPAGQVTLVPGSVFILYRRTPAAFDWTLSAQ
jgi:hypothetical protein